jgi:hypothetical protein
LIELEKWSVRKPAIGEKKKWEAGVEISERRGRRKRILPCFGTGSGVCEEVCGRSE